MAAGFRTRRIKCEYSIGDKLKRARIRKKITIAQVEEATRIRAKFILALEADSWDQIPSEVYGRGYLERYLTYLQLPAEQVMKQYGREREMYARNCQEKQVELAPKNRLQLPRFLLTPRFFAMFLTVMAVGGAGTLVVRQVQQFSLNPYLQLVPAPHQKVAAATGEVVVSDTSYQVAGKTAIGAAVEVNGRPVPVGEDGSFASQVSLRPGPNSILVKSTMNGKVTSEFVSVNNKQNV